MNSVRRPRRTVGLRALVVSGGLWVLSGVGFAAVGLVQLGFAGGYVYPEPSAAVANAVCAAGCVLAGIALIRRPSRFVLALSVGAAAVLGAVGLSQVSSGTGGWPFALAVLSAIGAGAASVVGAIGGRPATARVMARRGPLPPDRPAGPHVVGRVKVEVEPEVEATLPDRLDRTDVAVCLGLIALGVVIPLVLAVASGSLDVAHNDDYAFRRIAMGLYRTGRIELIGATFMNLIGLVVAAQPLLWLSGGSPWAFGVTTALLSVSGIASAYYLLRQVLGQGLAAVGVLGFVLFPGVLVYTTAYMTDVPALAAELTCLGLAAAAVRREGGRRMIWLAASLGVGCFAYSIRDFGLAAPAAVLAFALVRTRFRDPRTILLGVLTIGACVAIHAAVASLPGPRAVEPFGLRPENIVYVRWAMPVVALAVSPMIVLAVRFGWRRWRVLEFLLGLAIGIDIYHDELMAVLSSGVVPRVLVGNLLEPQGAPGGVGAGYRALPLDSPGWDVLNVVALLATVAGFAVLSASLGALWRRGAFSSIDGLVRRFGSAEGLLAFFALAYGGGMVVFGLGAPIYDRYVWPLGLPLAGLLLLAGRRRLRPHGFAVPADLALRAGAAALVAILAATSSVLMLNGFAYDTAGWHMGQVAVDAGYAPTTVDAGMVWVGYQATTPVRRDRAPANFNDQWPSFRLCAFVTSSPVDAPGAELMSINPSAYRLYLLAGPDEPMFLYRVLSPTCP